MCMGGSNQATQQANQMEAQRQGTINSNIGAINSAFANRTGEYSTYKTALQDQYQQELNRQQAIAARNNKFSMARSGLTGGSAAADASTLLGQEMAKGTVAAQQGVNSGVAKLQAADEATRQQMISLAQSGGDIGNAASQTASALQANIGNAQAVNPAAGLGDVFAGTTSAVNQAQSAAALRSGILKGQTYATKAQGGL
jgi:hypothetical protein